MNSEKKQTQPDPIRKKKNSHAVLSRKIRRYARFFLIWALALTIAVGYIVWLSSQSEKIIPPDCPGHLRAVISENATDSLVSLFVNGIASEKTLPPTILDSSTQNREGVKIVMNNRAIVWHWILGIFSAISFALCLVHHVKWRARCKYIIRQSSEVISMKKNYYSRLCRVIVVNIIMALLLFLLSYSGSKFTIRQVSYNVLFLISPVAMVLSSRFAAPLSISGMGCFFH